MDPIPEQMAAARAVGADRVELYTEPYAAAFGTPEQAMQLQRYADAAAAATASTAGAATTSAMGAAAAAAAAAFEAVSACSAPPLLL